MSYHYGVVGCNLWSVYEIFLVHIYLRLSLIPSLVYAIVWRMGLSVCCSMGAIANGFSKCFPLLILEICSLKFAFHKN